jgi:hypothetical protein
VIFVGDTKTPSRDSDLALSLALFAREEAFALRYQKLLIKEETQEEAVSLLELPEGLIEKGSKLWKITI